MRKIGDICLCPDDYGVFLIIPDPRPEAPDEPFEVEKAENTGSKAPERDQVMVLHRARARGGAANRLATGDCLIHLPSGVQGAVVGVTDGGKRFHLKVWEGPETLEKWLAAQGTGMWVVWGRCFQHGEALPSWFREVEVVSPNETPIALADQGFQGGGTPIPAPKWTPQELRAMIKRRGLRYLGRTVDAANIGILPTEVSDSVIAPRTYADFETKGGARLRKWTMGADEYLE